METTGSSNTPRPFSIDDSAASAVIGQSSLTGTSTGLNAYAIAFDSGGNLWVSDGISGVAEFEGPVSTGEAGNQVEGPKTVNGTGTSPGDKLRDPQGIAFDANDNLWVADYDHGRVVVYGSAVTLTTSSSSSSSTTTSTSGEEFRSSPINWQRRLPSPSSLPPPTCWFDAA